MGAYSHCFWHVCDVIVKDPMYQEYWSRIKSWFVPESSYVEIHNSPVETIGFLPYVFFIPNRIFYCLDKFRSNGNMEGIIASFWLRP